ncbi:hypothetical protein BGY98DRAFT_977601 [Russula aff. rugulosa BPL654]|nr:hypothetical protein BGY98DRAFT_977601 [Russula aff. rugulosa BPL654]
MPGPHNAKKSKRGRKKKKNHTNSRTHNTTSASLAAHTTHDTVPDLSSSPTLTPASPGVHEGVPWKGNDAFSLPSSPYGPKDDPTLILLSNPIIHDPGNGPRVKNMRAFLNSSFSQPAWMDDPSVQKEIALCLWYNKSRRIGRVCPACLRFGICSPLCYMLAAHRAPIAAKAAWGRMAEDLDDLEHPQSAKMRPSEVHDLGLAQLCVPDLVADEDSSDSCTQREGLEWDGRSRGTS